MTPKLSVCPISILPTYSNGFHISVSPVGHFIQVWLLEFHFLAIVNNLQVGMLLTKTQEA